MQQSTVHLCNELDALLIDDMFVTLSTDQLVFIIS
jgi:hypothetical protein